MRLRALASGLAILSSTTCVTGVELDPVHPSPVLQAVQPTSLTVGSAVRTIALTGHDFVESSEGTWNGPPRPTEFVSASEIRVTLDAADVAAPGTGTLGVSTPAPGGGVARPWTYTVGNAVATIDSLSPSSVEAVLTPAFTLRIFGTGFTSYGVGSQIVFDGATVRTVMVSPTELHADIPDNLLPRGASVSVRVLNPSPGGGASDPATFTVANPTPVLLGFSPDSVRLLEPAEIELVGTGFVPGMTVQLGPDSYEPTSISPTSIRLTVARVTSRDGTMRVQSPGPGGGASNAQVIGIQEQPPAVFTLLPSAVIVGRGDQVIRINGFNLAPDAEVTWNGVRLPTTYAVAPDSLDRYEPADTLIVTVPASLSTTVGPGVLRVTNPRSGGSAPDIETAALPEGRVVLTAAGSTPTVASALNGADMEPITIGLPLDDGGRAVLFDAWPTGERIAMIRAYGTIGEPGLFIGEPGRDPVMVTPHEVTSPRVSADGQWIYYVGDAWATTDTIWRITPDGATREFVAADAAWPEPSPTGDQVLLIPSSGAQAGTLSVLDLGTGVVTSLGVPAQEPRWSPDGQWIVYRTRNFARTLRLVRPDGTGDRPLSGSTWRYDWPGAFDWSPDSRYVLAVHHLEWSNFGQMEMVDVTTGDVLRWPTPQTRTLVNLVNSWRVSWYGDPYP